MAVDDLEQSTRRRILDATHVVFARSGHRNVQLSDVATVCMANLGAVPVAAAPGERDGEAAGRDAQLVFARGRPGWGALGQSLPR